MIQRLKLKNTIDIYDFVLNHKDEFEDFYITENKERKFINNLDTIKRLLKRQEVYGLEDNGLKAILIILREKNFRTYIKVLAVQNKYVFDLMKFISWNFNKQELYLKVKKSNTINKVLSFYDKIKKETVYRYHWNFAGDRGQEVLYVRKPLWEKSNDSNRRETEKYITR